MNTARDCDALDVDQELVDSIDPDAAVMLPGWLFRACARREIGHGGLLAYGAMLLLACHQHVTLLGEHRASCCFAMPSDVGRIVGLTPSRVRRILHELAEHGLIEVRGEMKLFLPHRWIETVVDDERPLESLALDVAERWGSDAYYLPRTIARLPTAVLTPGEKTFFALVRRYEKRWHGKVTAKQVTLGDELGIGPRQVQKFVASLEKKGLLDVELRRKLRRPSFMHTHVRTPWLDKTREEARAENQRQRSRRERG